MNTQTLNIALPEDLVKKIDELAKEEYRNRSEFIRSALLNYILNKEKWNDVFSYGSSVKKKLNLLNEEEITKIVSDFRHAKNSS